MRSVDGKKLGGFGILVLVAALAFAIASSSAASAQSTAGHIDGYLGLDGTAPSMELDANGIATIAYFQPDSSTINIARCSDTSCTQAQVTSPISITTGTSWPALRLNPSGNPVVAFHNNGRIDVLRCNDPACLPGGDTINTASNEANLIGYPALALSEAGLPTIAYVGPVARVRVVRCTTRSCSDATPPVAPSPNTQTASVPVIEMGVLDRPIIAHTEWNGEGQPTDLRIVSCSSPECGHISAHVVERQGNFANLSLDITTPVPGEPEMLHIGAALDTSETTRELRYFNCEISLCDLTDQVRARPVPRVDPQRRAFTPNMAISNSGPVFAYWDVNLTGDVQVASISPDNASTVTGTTRVMAPSPEIDGFHWPDIEIYDGKTTIATVDIDGLRVITCDNAGCIPACNGQPVTVAMAAGGQYARADAGDIVRGTMGPDTIVGGSVICALGGNDHITPSRASSTFAGAGHDFIDLSRFGKGFVSAGPGNDQVIGSAGLDRIFGGPGNDTLEGRGGTDRLSGGDGHDTLNGGGGDDKIFGNLGRDTIDGGPGNDIIKGGAWIDSVDGGDGDDDRCGIVAGEVRVNCERGVFGVGVVYGTCRTEHTQDRVIVTATWTNTNQPTNEIYLRRNGAVHTTGTFESTATFTDDDVRVGDEFTYVVRYRLDGRTVDLECGSQSIEAPRLGFTPFDVEFDPVRPLAYMTERSRRELHVVNLDTGRVINTIAFEHLPEALSVTPDGDELYVALPVQNHSSHWHDEQYGYFARIQLGDTIGTPEIFESDVDPYDIVATDDGYVVISSGSGQWTDIESYNGRTGAKISTTGVRQQVRLSLHPSQRIVYGADTDSGPSDIERWDLTIGGSLFGFGDSPYHGQHRMEGNVWASEDVLITRGGDAFTSGRSTTETDMVYLASLTEGTILAVDFDDAAGVVHVATATAIISYDISTFEQVAAEQLPEPAQFLNTATDRIIVVAPTGNGSVISAIVD